MPYDPGRPPLSQEKRALVLITLLFANLILISSQIMLRNQQSLLHTVLMNLAAPFQIGFQQTTDFVSRQLKHYVFLKNAYVRYQELQRRHTALQFRQHELQRLLHDQRARDRAARRQPSFRLANVVSVDINFPYHALLIDLGRRDGIVEEMVVLNVDSELVGRIVKPIGARTATVRLITSAVGGAGAYLQANMLEGFITGNNTAECRFKYLLENKPVRIGDTVVTSGTDLIFPPYLPVGRVMSIERDYLTQDVRVKPFFLEKPIKQLIVLAHEKPD